MDPAPLALRLRGIASIAFQSHDKLVKLKLSLQRFPFQFIGRRANDAGICQPTNNSKNGREASIREDSVQNIDEKGPGLIVKGICFIPSNRVDCFIGQAQ